MSNFTRAAYHPNEKVVRAATFCDDYFGPHKYGVFFVGDQWIYHPNEVDIPLDVVFVPRMEEKEKPDAKRRKGQKPRAGKKQVRTKGAGRKGG